MPHVSELAIYPLKSAAQIQLPSVWCDTRGFEFDRRFVLCEPNGDFITARKDPKLLSIVPSLTTEGVAFSVLQRPSLKLSIAELGVERQRVQIWNDELAGLPAPNHANEWFSEWLERPVQLVYNDIDSYRIQGRSADRPILFADGYPLLLTNTASLLELQRQADDSALQMRRFRPNLVIDDETPWVEDKWKRLKVGEVILEIAKPCERCVLTTRNPLTGERTPNGEPLRTLAKIHRLNNRVCFGQNLNVITPGVIQIGDTVEILE